MDKIPADIEAKLDANMKWGKILEAKAFIDLLSQTKKCPHKAGILVYRCNLNFFEQKIIHVPIIP